MNEDIFLTSEQLNKLDKLEEEFDAVFWKMWHKHYLGTREEMYRHLSNTKKLINEIIQY